MKKYLISIVILIIIGLGIFFLAKDSDLFVKNNSEPNDNFQEEQLNCQEIMKDVANKIGEISPEKPVLGGNWYVVRFWFISNSDKDFYVEYEDGHILRRMLLNAEKKNNEFNYDVVGYFEPGETTWELKKGEDPFFGETLILYEYNEETALWVKQN